MSRIHPTAIVGPQVELFDDVQVGPHVIIEGKVTIGPGSIVAAHTVIQGSTIVGANCRLGPAAYIGLDPQHLHYEGSETWLIVGDNTTVREMASVHRATKSGKENATRVGDHCLIMGGAHVGHDCQLGNSVILANAALLGGHCEIGNGTVLGGGCTIHQFVRIGRLAIIAGNEAVSRDIPPFAAVRYGGLKAYNAVGCRRAGISPSSIHAIRAAYLKLHTHRATSAALQAIRDDVPQVAEVRELLDFAVSARRGLQLSVRLMRSMAPAMAEDNS